MPKLWTVLFFSKCIIEHKSCWFSDGWICSIFPIWCRSVGGAIVGWHYCGLAGNCCCRVAFLCILLLLPFYDVYNAIVPSRFPTSSSTEISSAQCPPALLTSHPGVCWYGEMLTQGYLFVWKHSRSSDINSTWERLLHYNLKHTYGKLCEAYFYVSMFRISVNDVTNHLDA